VTLVRSSIPERDLGGVGLGCAAGAAVVLVLVLLCSWGWVVHYYSFLAAHAVHLCAVRWGVFLLLYRNSPARMFFRSLLTRGAGSSSACSATSPRRSSASSGGALVLGLLGAARWCRLLTQRRVRQCSGGGSGLVLGMLHVFHLPPTSAGGGSVSLLLFFYDRSHNCSLLRC